MKDNTVLFRQQAGKQSEGLGSAGFVKCDGGAEVVLMPCCHRCFWKRKKAEVIGWLCAILERSKLVNVMEK